MEKPLPNYAENLFKGAAPTSFEKARKLRQTTTDAEELLWPALRSRRLAGYKFRRQHPILNFIADFYCHEAALVVEIDGTIHDQADQAEYDASRTFVLAEHGIRVIRFTNDEVETAMPFVLQKILECLTNTSPPAPLLQEKGAPLR